MEVYYSVFYPVYVITVLYWFNILHMNYYWYLLSDRNFLFAN